MISVEAISALVGSLQEAALGTAGWSTALEGFCSWMGCDAIGLTLATQRTRRLLSDFCTGLPAEAIAAYNGHFWTEDLVPGALRRVAVGTARRITEIVPETRLRQSALYNEWALPCGMKDSMFVNLGQEGADRLTLCMTAGKPECFARPELPRALQILAPHLKLALRTRARLCALDAANDRALAALEHVRDGLAVVTPGRVVLLRNAAATEILSRRDSLILQGDRLGAACDAETLALRNLVERAGGRGGDIHRTGGSLRITRLSGDRPIVVHVLPLREQPAAQEEAGVLVLMIDPDLRAEPDLALMREVFGLSAAEAVVAARIARGDNLKSIAEDLAVYLTTVRTQLQNVFAKTDTHRQADLVRLLLRTGVA